MDDIIDFILVMLAGVALGVTIALNVQPPNAKTHGVCEYLHAEYNDNLCIKDNVVVFRGK